MGGGNKDDEEGKAETCHFTIEFSKFLGHYGSDYIDEKPGNVTENGNRNAKRQRAHSNLSYKCK